MYWLSDNYKWLFDGVAGAAAIAILAYLAKRLSKPETPPLGQKTQATLNAHRSTVTNSPVASGSGINQTVDARTVYVNFVKPASQDRSGSGIHDRQVDALLAIHSKLEQGLFYLQRAASQIKFKGEASDQELLQRMARDLAAASEEISRNKLLIDPVLSGKLDEFFTKAISARMNLDLAMDPMTPDGEQRATFWKQAQEIA